MAEILTVFLDDGGVMNDNQRRGPAWQRLVSAFFAPRLGGDPAAWMEANRVVAERQLGDYTRTMRDRTDVEVAPYYRASQVSWVTGMCALVGVPPPDDEACVRLSVSAATFITPRVDAAIPGAIEAIRALHADGYALHTASGEHSSELHGYLTGMGVRHCFGQLYGPDLVNTFKEGPLFYERIVADAQVKAAEALVVDDSAAAVGYARQAGARAVLVDPTVERPDAHVIRRLADLPALLESE
jgi:HAD superfamily hydrolase (TIGR01509 family)